MILSLPFIAISVYVGVIYAQLPVGHYDINTLRHRLPLYITYL